MTSSEMPNSWAAQLESGDELYICTPARREDLALPPTLASVILAREPGRVWITQPYQVYGLICDDGSLPVDHHVGAKQEYLCTVKRAWQSQGGQHGIEGILELFDVNTNRAVAEALPVGFVLGYAASDEETKLLSADRIKVQ